MAWPSPNWSVKDSTLPYSTTTPTSEDVTGAMDQSLWSEIGDTFLVKSNIKRPCGPAVYTDSNYFYFESRDQANCWPVADPCGREEENHIKNVVDPASWLYLK